jgi:hypothetical protein
MRLALRPFKIFSHPFLEYTKGSGSITSSQEKIVKIK